MANKLISLGNLTRYHQKLLENYDARVMARAPSGSDDAAYLETLFAKGRVLFPPGVTYKIARTVLLPDGTDVDMNGSAIKYTGPKFNASNQISGCAFLNVNKDSSADKAVLEYNGRGNMRFRNGEFIDCSFGFIHAHDLLFEDITFGEVSKNNHTFQLSSCKNVSFLRCTFHGIASTNDAATTEIINLDLSTPGQFIDTWFFPNGTATLDECACRDIVVDHCTFRPRNNSVYYDVIGYHANFMQPYKDEVSPDPQKDKQIHKCIRVTNNYIYGINPNSGNTKHTVAFNIRHMMNSIFANNVCENVESLANIDHVRQVTISGNVMTKNSNKSHAFNMETSWHSWGTGTVPDPTDQGRGMGYYTSSKNLNISGNSYGKATITFDTNNSSIYDQTTNWVANTDAKPRYSKEGATVTLHGRVKPAKALTLNAESNVMTLPEECRPMTTVAWVTTGNSYATPDVSFPVLVKLKSSGVLSLTPIGNSIALTKNSDIWIDGTYVM